MRAIEFPVATTGVANDEGGAENETAMVMGGHQWWFGNFYTDSGIYSTGVTSRMMSKGKAPGFFNKC